MQSMFLADLSLGRRAALQTLAGLASVSLSGSALAADRPDPGGLDLSTPADNLYAFGKIWAGFDRPVIGAFEGLMYLRMGDKRAVPVFGFTGTGAMLARIEDNGALAIKSRETAFFTDLRTGDILEYWDNPVTGERVDVYHFYDDKLIVRFAGATMPRMKMGAATDTPTLMNEGSAFPNEKGEVPLLMPFRPLGPEQMYMTWDYTNEYTNPVTPEGWPTYSTGPRVTPSEHFMFTFSKQQLYDRETPSVRTIAAFTRISQPWPFMRMGKSPYREASLFGRMLSHKGLPGTQEVPRKVLDYVEKHAPLYLQVPDGWGEPGKMSWNRVDTWKAFAQDVPPETPGYPWTRPVMEAALAPPTGLAAKAYR
jgi:hypothetical protein